MTQKWEIPQMTSTLYKKMTPDVTLPRCRIRRSVRRMDIFHHVFMENAQAKCGKIVVGYPHSLLNCKEDA
jgi:hypothetical protein